MGGRTCHGDNSFSGVPVNTARCRLFTPSSKSMFRAASAPAKRRILGLRTRGVPHFRISVRVPLRE